jgi:hypothetical protein
VISQLKSDFYVFSCNLIQPRLINLVLPSTIQTNLHTCYALMGSITPEVFGLNLDHFQAYEVIEEFECMCDVC